MASLFFSLKMKKIVLTTCGDLPLMICVHGIIDAQYIYIFFNLDPGEALLPVLLFPLHNPLFPSLPAGGLPQGRQHIAPGGLPQPTSCSNVGTWGSSADPGARVVKVIWKPTETSYTVMCKCPQYHHAWLDCIGPFTQDIELRIMLLR